MDLLQILQSRLKKLPLGPYTGGLQSVIKHIQVALNHHNRGENKGEEDAFTDAIYRTNQAFEGSLKEAYRVLAGKDPEKVKPYEIENYFQDKSDLRQRVISQISTYRKEWRNPATHDYKLDFDEDEALLAIVNVCTFAIVLMDQIILKVAMESTKSTIEPELIDINPSNTSEFADQIAKVLLSFKPFEVESASAQRLRESELVGEIAGYLSAKVPALQVETNKLLYVGDSIEVDLMLTIKNIRIIVEVKNVVNTKESFITGLHQLSRYLQIGGLKDGILYLAPRIADVAMDIREPETPIREGTRVLIVGPLLYAPTPPV